VHGPSHLRGSKGNAAGLSPIRGRPRDCERRADAISPLGASPGKAASAIRREPGDLPCAEQSREAAGGAAKEFMMICRQGCHTLKGSESPGAAQAVMAGLVPAIHAVTLQSLKRGRRSSAQRSEYS